MVLKLVSTKGSHTGFDASCSQGDKDQPHHGQRSEDKTQQGVSVSTHLCLCTCCVCLNNLSVSNSHVEGHVVWGAVLVRICDVMDSTYCQDDLSHRVNDGQVNNSPVQRREEEEEEELNRYTSGR